MSKLKNHKQRIKARIVKIGTAWINADGEPCADGWEFDFGGRRGHHYEHVEATGESYAAGYSISELMEIALNSERKA